MAFPSKMNTVSTRQKNRAEQSRTSRKIPNGQSGDDLDITMKIDDAPSTIYFNVVFFFFLILLKL